MFAFAAALSPGSRAEQWDSDHSAKAALWHPRMIFDLQHGRAGAAAGELLNFTTCILCSLAWVPEHLNSNPPSCLLSHSGPAISSFG